MKLGISRSDVIVNRRRLPVIIPDDHQYSELARGFRNRSNDTCYAERVRMQRTKKYVGDGAGRINKSKRMEHHVDRIRVYYNIIVLYVCAMYTHYIICNLRAKNVPSLAARDNATTPTTKPIHDCIMLLKYAISLLPNLTLIT